MRLKTFLETGRRAHNSAVRTPGPQAASEAPPAAVARERLDRGQPLH
jgi:hypothetical protein